MYSLHNLYLKYLLSEKLYLQEQHKKEIIEFKTDILIFEFSKQIREMEFYYELDTEILEIENIVKKFIREKQFNTYHQIKVDYQSKINQIIKKEELNSEEKSTLIKEIYYVLMKEYLVNIEDDDKGIEDINLEKFKKEFYEYQEKMRQKNIDDNEIISNSPSSTKTNIEEEKNILNLPEVQDIYQKKKINKKKVLYIFINILDIILTISMLTLIANYYNPFLSSI
jgi:hypothetical protein